MVLELWKAKRLCSRSFIRNNDHNKKTFLASFFLKNNFRVKDLHNSVVYQTEIMIHKTMKTDSPSHIYSRLSNPYNFRIKQSTSGRIRQDETFTSKRSLPRTSFRYRGAHDYNLIPANIRAISNLTSFKVKLKHSVEEILCSNIYSLYVYLCILLSSAETIV